MTTLRVVRLTREVRSVNEHASPFPTPSLPYPFGRPDDDGQPQYTLTESIGQGQTSRVFRGVWRRLCHGGHTSTVVAKIFHRVDSTSDTERALAEAAQMDRVKSPYVVRVLATGMWSGHYPYIVTEDHDGLDLERWAERHMGRDADPSSLPTIEDCVRIVRDAARGVQAAHESDIIHRDLSPRNLLVCADGLTRIMDFGCASVGETLGNGVVVGTPGFMPPEQWRQGVSVVQSDVAALGGILYWLVTGRMPYGECEGEVDAAHANAAVAHEVRRQELLESDVPKLVADAILSATMPLPQERTESAGKFASALDEWLAEGDAKARASTAEGGQGRIRRSYRRLLAASSLLIACVLVAYLLLGRGRGPLPATDEAAFYAWVGGAGDEVGARLLGRRLFELGAVRFEPTLAGPPSPGEFAASLAAADTAEIAILGDPDPLMRARCAFGVATLAFEAGDDERLAWWLARTREALDAGEAAGADRGSLQLLGQLCELTRGLRWYDAVNTTDDPQAIAATHGHPTEIRLERLRTEWTHTMGLIGKSLFANSSFAARWSEELSSVNDRLGPRDQLARPEPTPSVQPSTSRSPE